MFETSSMLAVSAVRSLPDGVKWLAASARAGASRTRHVFASVLLDDYRETLREIRETGYATYSVRQLTPYVRAARVCRSLPTRNHALFTIPTAIAHAHSSS